MKNFIQRYWLTLVGLPLGAAGGYIYYYFWGCTDGCPIKSNANTMMLYGTLMGGLLFNFVEDLVKRNKKKGQDPSDKA